ncbi:MAG: hypothetical protein QOE87_2854 [Gaiellales bacterium]|nr:hypothetical protein [Gaiellales bacterium]
MVRAIHGCAAGHTDRFDTNLPAAENRRGVDVYGAGGQEWRKG